MVGWEAPQLATINTPRTLPSDQERVLRLSESLSKNSDPIPYTINEQYPLESHPVDEKSLLLLSRECELNNYDPSDSNDNIKPRNYNSLKSLSARDRFEEMADESVVNNGVNSVPPSKSRKPPPVTSSAPTPPATSPTHNTNNSSNLTPNAAMPSNKERPNGGGGSALKRGLTSIFKRTNSNAHDALAVSSQQSRLPQGRGGSDPVLNKSNQTESNTSASATTASGSVTPPSAEQSVQNLSISESSGTAGENSTRPANNNHLEPATHQFFGRDRNRATSGLGIRQKLSSITFNVPPKDDAEAAKKKRDRASSSMDLISATAAVTAAASEPEIKSELKFQPWGLPPDAGTGLKARRISVSLPDDFAADSVDLYTEFSDQSKLIGRRGKTLGKGATSKVTIMVRKSKPDQLVAVKEFRGKAQSETPEEYAKKVWSEFSIARSLHHPNIIETIRLCKDSKGRWNHVMEYCEPGDLFHLVEEGYLKGKDRESDRLCMFKQLMQGINYLHSHGIAHRDIKLENLLLTSDSKLKITDFGVSEVFSGIHPGLRSANGECGKDMGEVRLCKPGICGSLPYIAPEVVAKKSKFCSSPFPFILVQPPFKPYLLVLRNQS